MQQTRRSSKLLAMLLVLVMLLSILPMGAMAAGGTITGSGTEGDPYLIADASDLSAFAANVNGGNSYSGQYVKLTSDISTAFTTVIGSSSAPFSGTFDGGGHTVNVNINGGSASRKGLFGQVTNGTVKNLTVSGSVTSTGSYIGGVVGYLNGGSVLNCGNTATISASGGYSAGVVGYTNGTVTIDGCYNAGNISGGTRIGGIVGEQYTNVTVSNCYNVGSISGTSSSNGGVVGYSRAAVTNCYHAVGTVSTTSSTGSKGAVIGFMYSSGSMSNCYYVATSSGLQGNSAGSAGTELTVDGMKNAASQLGASFMADSANINSGYPVLYWQGGGEAPDTSITDALNALVAENADYIGAFEYEGAENPYANNAVISGNSIYLDSYELEESQLGDSTADVYAVWTSSNPAVIAVPTAGYGTASVTHLTTAAASVTLTAYLTAVVDGVTYTSTDSVQYTFTVTQDVGSDVTVTVYVSIFGSDRNSPTLTGSGGRLMAAAPVTVTAPANTICVDDALRQAHEDYYTSGNGYETSSSGMITKLWGTSTESVGIYRNNVLTDVVTQEPLSDGDMITAFIYYNTSSYSDKFICFNNARDTAEGGVAKTFALTSKTYSGTSASSVASASVTVYQLNDDGTLSAAGISPSVSGSNVTVTFPTGTANYVLVAQKSYGLFTGRFVPGVCLVSVGLSDQDAVNDDKDSLKVNGCDNSGTIDVISYVDLPTSGDNGSAITWTTSNAGVITADGLVIRPSGNNAAAATVTLTATLTKGDAAATKSFTFSVAALPSDGTALTTGAANLDTLVAGLTSSTFEDNMWAVMDVVAYANNGHPTYGLSDTEKTAFHNYIGTFVNNTINSSKTDAQKSSDLAKAVIVLRALGYDNSDSTYGTAVSSMETYAANAMTAATANNEVEGYLAAASFVMMAELETADHAASPSSFLSSLRTFILDAQDSAGSWSEYVDINAFILAGLEFYHAVYGENTTVAAACANGAAYLKSLQKANGSFGVYADSAVGNANSTAFVIIGLKAVGALSGATTNGRDAIDGLMTFYNASTGSFQYGGTDNDMATEQAIRALIAANNSAENYCIYKFSGQNS